MSDNTHDPARLNQAAAHDTGLYDPTVHDNQIVALYDTEADARKAMEALVHTGFPASAMKVMSREDGTASAAHTAGSTGMSYAPTGGADEGLWGSIKSLFVPDEERSTYNTAITRGHAMLVVTPDNTMDRQHLIHSLEATNPLDFDAKLEEWRQTGYDTTGSATGVSTSNATTAGHAVDAGLNTGAGHSAGLAQPSTTMHETSTPAMPAKASTTGAANVGATAATPETIKVMEERLRVGKREVASGAVRVRSYVVERPVEEQVRLREEHVNVERRPVDRAATPADMAAFEERTIEARATSEEAVVSKEARIIEEIAVNKQASERTETVHDTVRKTEVEVEGDAASKTGSLPGNTGKNPNATPDAGTSGANTPRR